MNRCKIDSEGGHDLGVGVHGSQSLVEVHLQGNRIRFEGVRQLAECISASRQRVVEYRVRELEVLDLSQNSIDDEGGLLIAE